MPQRFNLDKYLPKIEYLLLDLSQFKIQELKTKQNSFIAKMREIEQCYDVTQSIHLFIDACEIVVDSDDEVLSSLAEWYISI